MTKTCRICSLDLPASSFHRKRSAADGLQTYCKDCNRQATYAQRQADPEGNRARQRRYDVRRPGKHGVLPEQRDEMVRAQGGRCAICRQETVLVVDHCHETGRVRGMLCKLCNSGLGFFKDDQNSLQAAISYLVH